MTISSNEWESHDMVTQKLWDKIHKITQAPKRRGKRFAETGGESCRYCKFPDDLGDESFFNWTAFVMWRDSWTPPESML